MKVEKIVQVVQELHIDINEITLLSIDEYMACKANIKPIKCDWWLRSPGNIVSAAVFVRGEDGHVYVTGNNVGMEFGVRPALKISKSNNLQIGEQFRFGGKVWTIVGDEFALADEVFCLMAFRENWWVDGANAYESSDIKKYLDEWLVDKQQDEMLG